MQASSSGEIRLLQHFNHENVLNLRDIMTPPEGAIENWNDIYLALELADTDLHYIIHSKQALTDEHIQYFIYQILRGLKAIHSAQSAAPRSEAEQPAGQQELRPEDLRLWLGARAWMTRGDPAASPSTS